MSLGTKILTIPAIPTNFHQHLYKSDEFISKFANFTGIARKNAKKRVSTIYEVKEE